MVFNIFKKKPKFKYAVVYAKITELSKQYMVYDFINNTRKHIEKEKVMSKRFKVGEFVIYIGKKNGIINTVVIGKITKLCKDGAYVRYGKTKEECLINYKNLYKIRNIDAISKITFKRN